MIMGFNGVPFVGQCLIKPAQSIGETQAVSGGCCCFCLVIAQSHKLPPLNSLSTTHCKSTQSLILVTTVTKLPKMATAKRHIELHSTAAPLPKIFFAFCHLNQLPFAAIYSCQHVNMAGEGPFWGAAPQLSMCVRASRAVITPDFHRSPWHLTRRPWAKQKCLTRIHKTWTRSSLFIASLCAGVCISSLCGRTGWLVWETVTLLMYNGILCIIRWAQHEVKQNCLVCRQQK